MIAKPVTPPINVPLAGAGTLFTTVVPLVLPSADADGLTVVKAGCALAGSFGTVDLRAPATAISAPASGVFTVTLDAARQVQTVNLKALPQHRISLLRLDGAKQAPPTVTATQGASFPDPPDDFTDRHFGVRVEDSSGTVFEAVTATALDSVMLRGRPSRPRLALSAPGQEATATPFWTAPAATTPKDTVAITGAAPLFADALQAFLDALEGPPGAALHLSLIAISDAPCKVTLKTVNAAYRLVRTRFAGEHATEPKVVLRFPAGSVTPADVTVAVPLHAKVASAELATSETLPAVLPPSGDWTDRATDLDGVGRGLELGPGRSAAARLTSAAGVNASRVALGVLVLQAPAELQVQVVADAAGAPSGPPLAEGRVALGADAAPDTLAPGRRAWVTVSLGEVGVPPGSACWIVVTASRGAAVWLARDSPPFTPARGHDGAPVEGLAVLAELLGPPVPVCGEPAPQPLALEVGRVAIPVGEAVAGKRTLNLTAALKKQRKDETVKLTFRATGPGNVTVYPPRIEYEVSA